MIYDLCVIGAGPAGLMAAITASKYVKNIILLEHNDKIGKKILLTGNGRCNITNYNLNSDCYNGDTASFAMKIISQFNNMDTISFFNNNGMLTHDRNGYVYPYTDQAATVVDIFKNIISQSNIKVLTNIHVKAVNKAKHFNILADEQSICANRLIIATGSKAYPKTGCDGSGYGFAKGFGHTIKPVLPALTALITDMKFNKMISGVRCNGSIELLCNDNIYTEQGEIQFTDYGISGIPVFQISRYAVIAIENNYNPSVAIDFLPDYTKEYLLEFVNNKLSNKKLTILQALSGIVNSKIITMILEYNNIHKEMLCKDVTLKHIEMIINSLKRFCMNITGYKGFDYGQVASGGVDTNELKDTLESKITDNLFFAGEIVDVDGICGGYNLQWALSSGYIAGRAACNDKN